MPQHIRYWNGSSLERANFTEEDVNRMLDFELMEKGVVKPDPIVLEEVKEVPSMATKTYLFVAGVGFRTQADVEAFLALKPIASDYDYHISSDYRYAKEVGDMVTPTKLYDRADITNLASIISANKAAKEANEQKLRAQQKEQDAVSKVVRGVWDDWHEMRDLKGKHERLAKTWAQYVELTKGDEALAVVFLLKAYSSSDIALANEFMGTTIPTEAPAQQEEASLAKAE